MCMDKPKVEEKWVRKRLMVSNITTYLNDNGFDWRTIPENFTIKNIKSFLQKDYGGDGDCTLTSILTIVKYYKPKLDDNEVYNYIEKIAKKYLYQEKWGTFPGFNKVIVQEVFKHFNIMKNVISKYFKGIGFNQNTIINELKQNHPVIISLANDGRKYYNNHTITIIGYMIFQDINGKKRTIFKTYDNWYSGHALLDYEILRADCMICY